MNYCEGMELNQLKFHSNNSMFIRALKAVIQTFQLNSKHNFHFNKAHKLNKNNNIIFLIVQLIKQHNIRQYRRKVLLNKALEVILVLNQLHIKAKLINCLKGLMKFYHKLKKNKAYILQRIIHNQFNVNILL